MKLKSIFIGCTGGALFSLSSLACAEHTWETQSLGSFTFSANVALTTDYVWRYVSQSDEKGAIQGGFDVAHSTGLYAGTWASNVDFDEGGNDGDNDADPSMEWDIYGGFAHEFDMGLGVDVGGIQYRYPGEKDLQWTEWYGGLSYTLWGVGLSGSVNYSDDVLNLGDDGVFYTAAAEYTLDFKYPISISADYGYYDFDREAAERLSGNRSDDSYHGWRLGANVDVHGFVFDVSYHDTKDAEAIFGDWADSRVVATISTSF